MEPDISKKLDELEQKIDKIYKSAEKTRKYFLWSLIISIAFIVLPLIGLAIIIPLYLRTLSNLSGLGL